MLNCLLKTLYFNFDIMPFWPYEDFEACVLDQASKGHSEESANKICWAIKARLEVWEDITENCVKDLSDINDSKLLAGRVNITPELAKKIIDALDKKWLDARDVSNVLYRLETMIQEEALKDKLNKASEDQLDDIIDNIIVQRISNEEYLSEIHLSEWWDVLGKEFELITTAKQTDSRYWNFEFSKEDLLEMATNFNNNVVGTEIPVDLNHDPEHIAYAWIVPGSMNVKESTQLTWQFSLFAKLHKFTPEWADMVKTGKVRYFSLQIQHKFEKFVDSTKKVFKNVIRALALTNMPVIKDMSPTFSENKNNLSDNHNNDMEIKELETKLSEATTNLSEKEIALAETEAKNKELSEKLEAIETEKHEAFLSESLEKLSLSEDNKIGFKGGEKEKVEAFVKTLSAEQAKEYFSIHQDIITSANFNEEGTAEGNEEEGGDEEKVAETAAEEAAELATKMAKEESISYSEAMNKVLDQNKELASKLY